MEFAPLEDNRLRKKRILKISYFFVGILLLLTFFSNTINNFSLPRVSVEQPVSGALIKEASGEGIVQARKLMKEYADPGMLVKEVRVKPGDKVVKGQALIILDSAGLERQLETELIKYDQMELNLEKLSGSGSKSSQDAFERDIEIAERSAETAKEDLKTAEEFYHAGSVSGDEVRKAEMNLLLAERELDNAYRKQSDNARDIKSQQDSLRLEEITIGELRKKLAEVCTLASPVDGIVNGLNVAEGDLTTGSVPAVTVADTSKGFEVRIPVDKDKAKYFKTGDEADISVKSLDTKPFKGAVREIAESVLYKGEKKDLVIDVDHEGIIGGENAEIYVGKKTGIYDVLVPNTAIGADENGKFVWTFIEKQGPLGSEFYVRKSTISTDDSDSSKTAVKRGLDSDEYIVVRYSKNISDGSRVIPYK